MSESTRLQAPAVTASQPVTVEIPGIAAPARFGRLEDAIAAVWASMKALPIDRETLAAYELLVGPDADPQRVEALIGRDGGHLTLTFAMFGTPHVVRFSSAAGR